MHLYLQLTRSLAVTLIWLYCNKLVLRYVRLRVSDLGQVSSPQPGIVIIILHRDERLRYALSILSITYLYCESSKEMLQTMWLDLANLFHAFQASPVNFVQVISDTPFGLWFPFKVRKI